MLDRRPRPRSTARASANPGICWLWASDGSHRGDQCAEGIFTKEPIVREPAARRTGGWSAPPSSLGLRSSMIPESLLNTAPTLPLHRVCMLNGATPEHLLSLVRVGQAHWLRKWLRRIAVAMAARSLGSERFESLSAHSTAIPANPLTQTH